MDLEAALVRTQTSKIVYTGSFALSWTDRHALTDALDFVFEPADALRVVKKPSHHIARAAEPFQSLRDPRLTIGSSAVAITALSNTFLRVYPVASN